MDLSVEWRNIKTLMRYDEYLSTTMVRRGGGDGEKSTARSRWTELCQFSASAPVNYLNTRRIEDSPQSN